MSLSAITKSNPLNSADFIGLFHIAYFIHLEKLGQQIFLNLGVHIVLLLTKWNQKVIPTLFKILGVDRHGWQLVFSGYTDNKHRCFNIVSYNPQYL